MKRKEMEFLYPIVRQFPFDEVCEQIVRELEKRNWKVPGIDVEFRDYGSGAQKFRAVSQIKNRDFKLWFSRIQRTMPGGRWNDIAAVSQIVIPKKELNVYGDESGPTFYLYVGDDYERDCEKFMNGSKVLSRLYNEPRMYLEYKGAWSNPACYIHPGKRPPLLVHTNDLGREYDPEGDEPEVFHTDEVMAEFRQYLKKVVLKMIVSRPVPAEKIDMLAPPEPIPFPQAVVLGELFCFGEYRDAQRIRLGKADPLLPDLHPADCYGMLGNGRRLMPLDVPNDGTVPKIAYEGFLWCGIASTLAEVPVDSLDIHGHNRWSDRDQFVIRVRPNRANDIYIADHAPYERRREVLVGVSVLGGRKMLTDAEVADFTRARARTIVPISEYKGGYEQPVVLINRELSFDEVEVMGGRHRHRLEC